MMDDWAWDPERVSEALARAVTQVRAPPAELTIGGDALFGLNALRHLPPAVYEAIIYHWYAWTLVMPSDAENAKGKLKKLLVEAKLNIIFAKVVVIGVCINTILIYIK